MRNYTLVTGPPCAGKSTLVRELAGAGDIVVDFDALAFAISPNSPRYEPDELLTEIVRATRVGIIRHWRGVRYGGSLYVIDSCLGDPGMRRYRLEGADVITVDPGLTVCLERASRERPPDYRNLILQWYEERR